MTITGPRSVRLLTFSETGPVLMFGEDNPGAKLVLTLLDKLQRNEVDDLSLN
jgi:hypothetical protein